MKPKIAYLVDNGFGWGEPPDWKFYSEEEYEAQGHRGQKFKRIVYWEIEDEGLEDR